MNRPFNERWEIAPADVARAVRASPDSVVLLDCREPEEVATAAIEGAVHIPMGEIEDRFDEIEELEAERIVVFCHAGVRSLKVAGVLRAKGLEQAFSMAGGIDRWSQEIDPGVPRY